MWEKKKALWHIGDQKMDILVYKTLDKADKSLKTGSSDTRELEKSSNMRSSN